MRKILQNFFPPSSLYSKLFFMAIVAIIKSSFEPFVYSARLFLLLIDFLLHIMGIQIRIKSDIVDVVGRSGMSGLWTM